jgi:mediator of RNA polymerase II transcription subunit 4
MTHPPTSDTETDTIPIRTQLFTNLTRQSQLITDLFGHLASGSTGAGAGAGAAPGTFTSTSTASHPVNVLYAQTHPLQSMYGSLQDLENGLADVIDNAWDHQAAFRALMAKREEVVQLELKVRDLVRKVEQGRGELEVLVREGRERLPDIKTVTKSKLSSIRALKSHLTVAEPLAIPPLIAHAIALSRTTSAPTSQHVPPSEKGMYAPWPTEVGMRTGLLFQMSGSMSGVGDTGVIGDGESHGLAFEQFTELLRGETSRSRRTSNCRGG